MAEKRKFFFGWVVMIACFVVSGLYSFVGAIAFNIFATPAAEEFGVTYGAIMMGSTLAALGATIASPLFGRMIGSRGLRVTALVSTVIIVVAFLVLAFMHSLVAFYIGFFFVGFGAQNTGHILSDCMSTKWFYKYRGFSSGLCATGGNFFGIFLSPLVTGIITSQGMDTAFLAIAIGFGVICITLCLTCLRNDPRDMGLYPDGADQMPPEEENANGQIGLTLKESMRTSTFWFSCIVAICAFSASLAFVSSYFSLLLELGFDAGFASIIMSLVSVVAVISSPVMGSVAQKFNYKAVIAFGFACFIVGALLVMFAMSLENVGSVYLFAVIVSWGNMVMFPVVMVKNINENFGPKHFADINGFMYILVGVGAMLGSTLIGLMADAMGGIQQAYVLFIILSVIGIAAALCIRKPAALKMMAEGGN